MIRLIPTTRTTLRWSLGLVTAAALVVLAAGCGGDDDGGGPITQVDGHLYTVAGVADECGIGRNFDDGKQATRARMYWPQDLTMNAAGEILVADWNNHIIRSI